MDGQRLPDMETFFRADVLSMLLAGVLSIVATAGLCLTLYIALMNYVPWND
jgi:hypothetical protein